MWNPRIYPDHDLLRQMTIRQPRKRRVPVAIDLKYLTNVNFCMVINTFFNFLHVIFRVISLIHQNNSSITHLANVARVVFYNLAVWCHHSCTGTEYWYCDVIFVECSCKVALHLWITNVNIDVPPPGIHGVAYKNSPMVYDNTLCSK